MKKLTTKMVVIEGKDNSKLTDAEREVLHLVCDDFLSERKIAMRRNCSQQAVNKILHNLRNKGYVGIKNIPKEMKVVNGDGTSQPHNQEKQIRYHGEQWNIGILWKDPKYKDSLGKTIYVDGNAVRCHQEVVDVYSVQSFFGGDVRQAVAKSCIYWQRFFNRLESDLHCILVKPRAQNIKLVKSHYAQVGNELATECELRGDKIQVRTEDDGKVWFIIDNSFNLREAETVHPGSAEHDMQDVVVPFFNDLKHNAPPKLSEMMLLIKQVVDINKETAAGLNAVVQLMKPKDEENLVPLEKPDYFG